MIKSLIAQYDSSTVQSAAYNYEHKTLTVHFNHASYLYKGVSAADFEAFHTAESQGKSLNEVIKPKYSFEKINEVIQQTVETNQMLDI
jgi:hypothetical protein